jgi:hypothetical protein
MRVGGGEGGEGGGKGRGRGWGGEGGGEGMCKAARPSIRWLTLVRSTLSF